jgi:hypothetical protein
MSKSNPDWDYEATYSSNIRIKELTEEVKRLENIIYKMCNRAKNLGSLVDDATYDWYIEQLHLKSRRNGK